MLIQHAFYFYYYHPFLTYRYCIGTDGAVNIWLHIGTRNYYRTVKNEVYK